MSSIAGKGCERLIPTEEKKPLEEIERSLVKKYRKHIWTKFVKAVKDYNLVEEGDKIAVAISGGKDSLLMAKCFQELKKHGQMNFELEFIAMDPGYHPQIKELLIENCNHLGIPVHIYEGKIFEVVDKMARDYPCYLCARMRRGSLYSKAKELGCNTTLLNVLYAGNFKTMLPKLKAANFEGMELIRPLYYVEEEYIKRFTNNAGIWPLNCACMVSAEKIGNKRYEIKELIKELKKNFDGVEKSIFKAAENVSLDSILGWEKDGIKTKYLEVYDEE